MPERAIKSLIVSVIIAVVLYFSAIFISGYQEILDALQKLDSFDLLFILTLSLLNYGLRFLRWHWYVKEQGYTLPILRHGCYYLSGFALTTTPGKIGEAIRSRYLKRHGMPYSQSLATFFMERFLDFCAIALLSCAAILHFPGYEPLLFLVVPIIIITLLVTKTDTPFILLRKLEQRRPTERIKTMTEKLHAFFNAATCLLKNRLLFGGLFIGIIAWGAEGVAFYYIMQFLEIESSLWIAIGIYSISIIIGALSFIPGGLGSTEAVMGLLLIALGAEPATAIAATLICRITTLWFAVILGAISMSWLELKHSTPVIPNE